MRPVKVNLIENMLSLGKINRGIADANIVANSNNNPTFYPVQLPDNGMYSDGYNLNRPTLPLPTLPFRPLVSQTQPIPDDELILDDTNFLPNLSNIG